MREDLLDAVDAPAPERFEIVEQSGDLLHHVPGLD
jgi:hypothetical protein